MTVFIGSLADPTFRYTVDELAARGVCGDVIDIALLALAGDLRLPLDGGVADVSLPTGETVIGLPAVARLIDLSRAAPTDELRRRAQGVQLALSRYLRSLPWPSVIGGTWDNSNFSKAFQLQLASSGSWSLPRSLLTNDPVAAPAVC